LFWIPPKGEEISNLFNSLTHFAKFRYMFWSELSSNDDKRPSKIWRPNMDGKNATAVVQSGLSVVSGIALDLVKKQIYWADQGQE